MLGNARLERLDPRARALRLPLFPHAIQRGNVAPGKRRKRAQDILARRTRAARLAHAEQRLGQRLLAFADEHRVEERRIGLGVENARPAAKHDRVVLRAIDRTQGNARQVEHFENVGRRKLVRQRDANRIESRKRGAAFEREHRDALFTHEVDQVDRRQKRALGGEVLSRVHRVHEDTNRLIRLPELVGVRVDHAIVEVRAFLARAPPFVVEIARRSLHARKQRLKPRPQVDHVSPSIYP